MTAMIAPCTVWKRRSLPVGQGQLAGGSFGTAIEGYHTDRINEVYGTIDRYVTDPETVNDDVVYELVFLDVFERSGRGLTSRELALEWVREIPFGWSAEWIALHNLADGILPPASGSWRNPYSDWIGAQMRGMVCGMLAPGWPREAARLAHLDGVISHSANGVYGEIFAAVLTSLAFVGSDLRDLLDEAKRYLPARSEFADVVKHCLQVVKSDGDPASAWRTLDRRFEQYNWIHAYPNIAADILALWFGQGDMTRSFSLLAHAGLDVDCNAGLVGNVAWRHERSARAVGSPAGRQAGNLPERKRKAFDQEAGGAHGAAGTPGVGRASRRPAATEAYCSSKRNIETEYAGTERPAAFAEKGLSVTVTFGALPGILALMGSGPVRTHIVPPPAGTAGWISKESLSTSRLGFTTATVRALPSSVKAAAMSSLPAAPVTATGTDPNRRR